MNTKSTLLEKTSLNRIGENCPIVGNSIPLLFEQDQLSYEVICFGPSNNETIIRTMEHW